MLTHANCPKLRKTRATIMRFKQWIYERLAPVFLKIFVAEQNKTKAVIKLKFLKSKQIILERAGYVWVKRGITSSALLIFFYVLLQSTTDMFVTEEAAKEVEVSCLCRRIKKIKAPLSNFAGLVCCLGFPFYPFFFFFSGTLRQPFSACHREDHSTVLGEHTTQLRVPWAQIIL